MDFIHEPKGMIDKLAIKNIARIYFLSIFGNDFVLQNSKICTNIILNELKPLFFLKQKK